MYLFTKEAKKFTKDAKPRQEEKIIVNFVWQ
jgi:hypothetical protein